MTFAVELSCPGSVMSSGESEMLLPWFGVWDCVARMPKLFGIDTAGVWILLQTCLRDLSPSIHIRAGSYDEKSIGHRFPQFAFPREGVKLMVSDHSDQDG